MALADLFTKAKKKVDDYFAPTPQVRTRDFVREAPKAISQTFGAVKSRGLAGLGETISSNLQNIDYFKPAPIEKPKVSNLGTGVRLRDFVREIPTGIGETANKFAQDATRFGISAMEAPKTFQTKQATGKFYDTPVGRVNSFQSEAQERVKRGDPLWKAIGNPAAETVLFGAPDVAATGKAIVKSPVVKAVGKKLLGKTLQNEAKDIVADAGLKVAQLARPYAFGKNGSPYRSKLVRGLSRPGLTVQDISKNGAPDEEWFKSLSKEDQMKVMGVDESEFKIDFPDMLGDSEIESQYSTFKNLLKNPKLRLPGVKEKLLNGDLETLRRELVSRGIMSRSDVDNMLYHGEKSGDEVLESFKSQLMDEDPGLLSGRKIAKSLGLVKEKVKSKINEADAFLEEMKQVPFGGYLPAGEVAQPLLLGMGRPFSSKEAKRIFKKTGQAVDFKNILPPSLKELRFGETGGEFARVKVDASVPTQKVPVDYNFVDSEAPQNLSTVRKWITSGKTILDKMGSVGKQMSSTIEKQRKTEDLLRGSYQDDVREALAGLSGRERLMVTDLLEGAKIEAPENVKMAAQKMRGLLDEIAQEAQTGGFEIRVPGGASVPFKARENYFPRQYNFDELARGAQRQRALDHLVKTGQARNLAEAEKFLDEFIVANVERRAGNLENARMFDLPDYERDPLVALQRYAASVAKRFSEAKYFGKKDEMIASMINKIGQNGGDYNEAQRIFDFMVNGAPKNDVVGAITKYNVATKLDLAFLINTTQSLNTMTKAGIWNTIRGAIKGFTKEGRRIGTKAGVIEDSHIYEQEAGKFDSIVKAVMIPLRVVEAFSRRTAANTGVIRAKQLFERAKNGNEYAIRELQNLGIDPRKATLTENDLLSAANAMSNATQFRVEAIDIPPAWKTPLGRLLTQFKSFSFKQTKFVRDEILKEADRGNYAPLIRFIPLAIGASYGVQYLRNILTGRDPDDDTKNVDIRQWDKWLKGFGTIPTDLIIQGKFLKDTYDSEYLTTLKKMSRAAGTVLGPTAGSLGSWISAIESIDTTQKKNDQLGIEKEKQDPFLDLKRQVTGEVPLVGEYAKNTLFPYKKSDKTDEEKAQTKSYFKKKDEVIAGLTTKERAALDALPASNPLNPWAKLQKYTTYRTSPAVFEAKRQLAIHEAGGDMSKVDPLFRYEYESIKPYLAYQSLLPNARERKALRDANPLILQIGKERSDFFDANPIDPEFQQPQIPGMLPYPEPDAETEQLMQKKNWKHPKVQAYFDAKDMYEAQIYALAGVPYTQDGFGFGSGGGKKKGEKPQYGNIPFRDLDDFLISRGLEVSPKAQFGTKAHLSSQTFQMPSFKEYVKKQGAGRKVKRFDVSFRGRKVV